MAQSPHIRRPRGIERLQGMAALSLCLFMRLVCSAGQLTNKFRSLQLTPFVTRKVKATRGRFEGDPKGALSGEGYLQRWKEKNGKD